MTIEQFIEQTKDMPRNTIIMAYDSKVENVTEITKLLFTPFKYNIPAKLEICTNNTNDATDDAMAMIDPMTIMTMDVKEACEHGTALDVHCCNCHSGFLFTPNECVCFHDDD